MEVILDGEPGFPLVTFLLSLSIALKRKEFIFFNLIRKKTIFILNNYIYFSVLIQKMSAVIRIINIFIILICFKSELPPVNIAKNGGDEEG